MNFLFDFTLFVIDIYHIMLISLFPTPFDHFQFHPTLGLDPALILTLRLNQKALGDPCFHCRLDFLNILLSEVQSTRPVVNPGHQVNISHPWSYGDWHKPPGFEGICRVSNSLNQLLSVQNSCCLC